MVNGTDEVCLRTPVDRDVKYILDYSQTNSDAKYSAVDPTGIRASRIAMRLKVALEKLNIKLKMDEALVTDTSSMGKISKARLGKMFRKILERLKKDAHKTKSRRDVKSKMLEPMIPLVQEILSSLLSRSAIRAYLNQQLKDKTSLISYLFGKESFRMQTIRRLEQLNNDSSTHFSASKRRRNDNVTTDTVTPLLQSCCDCQCSDELSIGNNPAESKSCMICYDEITADNSTLRMTCSHSGDFHTTVCLHKIRLSLIMIKSFML
jgi:hypothetical protein